MKKLFGTLIFAFAALITQAQLQVPRNYLNANIVSNGTNQITALKLNTVLNLMLNADSIQHQYAIDSIAKTLKKQDSLVYYVTPSQLSAGLADKQNNLGYVPESTSNKTTSANGSSNALYPTQKAVKDYVDLIATSNVKYSDTATTLSPYAKKAALADSAATLRGLITGGGTSGLLDTASALRTALNQRAKYTDTAAMLTPYLRNAQAVKYTDTAALILPYATKAKVLIDSNALVTATNARVKYTDTAAMLSPYLRDGDSVSLSNRINLKIDSIRRLPGATTVQMKINGTWVNAYTDSTGSGGGVSGSGTSGYLPKFSGSSTLGNSLFRDNGSETSIGGAPVAGVNFSVYGASAYRIDLLAGVGLGNLLQSYDGGSSAFRPLRYSASQHDFQISGTTKATIDGSGDFYLNSIVGTNGSNPLIFKLNGVESGRLTANTTRYGYNTSETGGEGIVIGALANNSGFIGMAIGYAAQCSGQEAISIGRETLVAGNASVGIGRGADVNGSSVAYGRFAISKGDENIALGSRTKSTGTYTSIAVGGYSTEATGSYSQAYGKLATASHLGSVVINTNSGVGGEAPLNSRLNGEILTNPTQVNFILSGGDSVCVKPGGVLKARTTNIRTFTPTGSADAAGAIGDEAWDDSYYYRKTSAGWKRTALSTF